MSQTAEVTIERHLGNPALVVTGVRANDYSETPLQFILTRAILMTLLAWGIILAVARDVLYPDSDLLFIPIFILIIVPIFTFRGLFEWRVKSEPDDVHVFDLINVDDIHYEYIFQDESMLNCVRNSLSDPVFAPRVLHTLSLMRDSVSPSRIESKLVKINRDRTRAISSPSLLDRI